MKGFLATGLLAAAFAVPAFAVPDVGDEAPDITPTATWNDKGKAKLSDFRGGVVMLNIWATW